MTTATTEKKRAERKANPRLEAAKRFAKAGEEVDRLAEKMRRLDKERGDTAAEHRKAVTELNTAEKELKAFSGAPATT